MVFLDGRIMDTLVNNLEEIMHRLETDAYYPYYVLGRQTSILEDYLALNPGNRERIKRIRPSE